MQRKLKTPIFVLVVLISILMAGCSPTPPADVPPTPANTPSPTSASDPTSTTLPYSPDAIPQTIDIPWDDRDIFRDGLISSEQDVLNDLPGASVYHIGFQISDDYLTLTGWEEVHYTNREKVPLEEIYFQLFPNASGGAISISSLTVAGQEVEPFFEFENTALRVDMPTPLEVGSSIDIRMDFEVQVSLEMAGNYGLFGFFKDILVLDEFYPVIPVYDDEGWNVQAPPPNADTSYFDSSFYLVKIAAPASLVIAASGIEVDKTLDGDTQTLTYAAGPSRDFYLAGSESFIHSSRKVGETTINSYVLKGYEQSTDYALQFAQQSIESLGEQFGIYPYTEFDVFSHPMEFALGIEYPGIVGILTTAYQPGAVISDVPYPAMLESLIAHEAAHQWFYGIVGNDQIDEPWLDEGMAQYSGWLYYADLYGEANAKNISDSWYYRWNRVEQAKIPIGLPAAIYEGREYSGIIYGRSAIFISTLAAEMGDAAFKAFLKDYYQTHQWGIATSNSFKASAEAACDCDLTALFEEWVYPQLRIKDPN